MSKSHALLWDLDGTLIDSEHLHAVAARAAMPRGERLSLSDIAERTKGNSAIETHRWLAEATGSQIGFDNWMADKLLHYRGGAGQLRQRPGALAIFHAAAARGWPQAIVSNSSRGIVEINLAAIGLASDRLITVSRNDVRLGKPDPEPCLRACHLLGVPPAAAILIEDSPKGAQSGLAAGLRTLLWPEHAVDAPAGVVLVDTADQLQRYLFG